MIFDSVLAVFVIEEMVDVERPPIYVCASRKVAARFVQIPERAQNM
jgi:hypothetical protein